MASGYGALLRLSLSKPCAETFRQAQCDTVGALEPLPYLIGTKNFLNT